MSNNPVGSVRSYVFGFVISLLLTFAAYIPAVMYINSDQNALPREILISLLLILAVLQLFVQLIFFLHLGHEKGPRWNLVFFLSTVSIFFMVVVGSIWIMYHLNYNMMPQQMEEYLIWKEGIHKP